MIEFMSVEPEQNRIRHYTLEIQSGLFGDVCLITRWGRGDQASRQTREYWFDVEEDAIEQAKTLFRRRVRNRYRVTEKGYPYVEILERLLGIA